jgi:hypothetical protein
MRRTTLFVVVVLTSMIGVLGAIGVPSASAQDVTCPLVLTAVTVEGNLIVPPNGECTIIDVTVKGNVLVPDGGFFRAIGSTIWGSVQGKQARQIEARNGSVVRGDFQGDGVREVFFLSSELGGDFQAKGATEFVRVCQNLIRDGDISVEKNNAGVWVGATPVPEDRSICRGNTLEKGNILVKENVIGTLPHHQLLIERNDVVAGNLQVYKNTGGGAKAVMTNTVQNGVIQCYENSPPFVGGPNTGRADPWMDLSFFPFFGPNQCSGTS